MIKKMETEHNTYPIQHDKETPTFFDDNIPINKITKKQENNITNKI